MSMRKSKRQLLEAAMEKEAILESEQMLAARKIVSARAGSLDMTVQEYLKKREKIARAKRISEKLGLAYWPAVAYGPRIDPRAYALAEKFLHARMEKNGQEIAPWEPGVSHGVWDMTGKTGISPWYVAACWEAAGCKPSGKFFAQLVHGQVAKRGQSLSRYLDWVKGKRWAESKGFPASVFPRKTLETLGRLAPISRNALVENLEIRWGDTLRVRDLDWENLRMVRRKLAFLGRQGASFF